jgi:signal transduction histidine kinase
MKIWLWTILMVLIFNTAYAVLKKDTIDTQATLTEAKALVIKARRITLKDPDSALKIASKALVLSKKINYKLGIGHSFNIIGVAYWVQSYLPISQFYLTMATPYLSADKASLSGCYRNIARNYVELKNYDKALYYFNQAIKLIDHDVARKAEYYTELTSLYNATKDYTTELRYVDTAFKYSRAVHNQNLIGILYNRLGQVYINNNKLALAQSTLDTCNQIALRVKNRRLRVVLTIDYARLYTIQSQLSKAIDCANKGYILADSIGATELKLRALKVLTEIYTKQGNLKLASQTQTQTGKLYDAINIRNNEKSLQLIQDYFVLNNKLNHIEQINVNNTANQTLIHKQHRTIALLVASLMTALTFLIVIFIYYKQKNQLNNQLQEQHKVLLEQKKLIEIQRTDLEEVNKVKDKMMAIIGHDLRTPVASLSSVVDMFTTGYIDNDEVRKIMLDLTPLVKGAELTLSNLMEFAGSQLKGQNVAAAKVDICEITKEMQQTFEHQLQQKNITFTNICHQEHSIVWADVNHVRVILRNLISNAIKFTRNNGTIKVITTALGDSMEICVEDTGVGMSPHEVGKLFKPNQHFSQRGTSGESGTGLGLLLCKELVELNKGILRVETISGQGCRFYFTLPTISKFVEASV